MAHLVPEGAGGASQGGPTRAGSWPARAQGLGSPGRSAPPQPLATLEGRPLWMPPNHQKLNLLLHRNFCEVGGLNTPEVFA